MTLVFTIVDFFRLSVLNLSFATHGCFHLVLHVSFMQDDSDDDQADDDLEIHRFDDAEIEVNADDDLAVRKFMSK